MKITFVLPTVDLSGGIRVVAIYAEKLLHRGHEVFVVFPPNRPIPLKRKVKLWFKGEGWSKESKCNLSYFDSLRVPHHILDRWRPVTDVDVPDADVIVATWWETAEWVVRLSENKGAKALFIQGYENHTEAWRERLDATWRLPFHKITISQWLVKLAEERFEDKKASLVPNSVDFSQFNAPPRAKQKILTVGMVYTPLDQKGSDIILKAVELASSFVPELRLVGFGSCPLDIPSSSPEIAQYFCQPAQDKLKDIYASCDAWLFGSRQEGFGLPILEAMACRTPVIGTPAGAAPELLAEGGGILVKPEDPEDMANAIKRIDEMSDVGWREMSDAAYTTAKRYSWDDATMLFEEALETAVERAARGEIAGGAKQKK